MIYDNKDLERRYGITRERVRQLRNKVLASGEGFYWNHGIVYTEDAIRKLDEWRIKHKGMLKDE